MAKLVAIGDSLTQGFQSFAITHTDLSYPAVIAGCLGLAPTEFLGPDFTSAGGLPCNIEWIARRLQHLVGSHIESFEWPSAFFDVVGLIDEVEEYWERGHGSRPGPDTLFHNLAVWGFEVGDSYNITAGDAYDIVQTRGKSAWYQPPSEPRMRTTWRVLNPALAATRMKDTQIDAAKRIKTRDGVIENLIVWLGANNCLPTVIELDADNTTGDVPPGPFSGHTLWRPAAFDAEYSRLAEEIAAIGASNVYVATIPHVTIPPITYGVMSDGGDLPSGEKYFDKYVRFFSDPARLKPPRDRLLTGESARLIDDYIDQYNGTIRAAATQHRWEIVDVGGVLDQLAFRRNHGVVTYALDPAIADLDARYLRFDGEGRRLQGGLFSLDGVHPTTCGYGVIAHEFVKVMRGRNPGILDVDFKAVRNNDTLIHRPPHTLHDLEGMLDLLERRFHLSRWLSPSPT